LKTWKLIKISTKDYRIGQSTMVTWLNLKVIYVYKQIGFNILDNVKTIIIVNKVLDFENKKNSFDYGKLCGSMLY